MKPFFSIVIPVYNVAPWLRECLDSVLAQTYDGWEAVCVDDGSSDDSSAILDEYAARDSRFHVTHKANGGVSSARNAALDQVRGDWILFLDGDDVFLSGSFERLHSAIMAQPAAQMFAFGTIFFADGGMCEGSDTSTVSSTLVDVSSCIPDARYCSFFGGKSYRRDIVAEIRFKPYMRGEDLLFLSRCLCRVNYIADSDVMVYGYRQRESSAMHSKLSARSIRDRMMASTDVLNTMMRANKRFPRSVYKAHITRLVIIHSRCILSLKLVDQLDLWGIWLKSLVCIAGGYVAMSIRRMLYVL